MMLKSHLSNKFLKHVGGQDVHNANVNNNNNNNNNNNKKFLFTSLESEVKLL